MKTFYHPNAFLRKLFCSCFRKPWDLIVGQDKSRISLLWYYHCLFYRSAPPSATNAPLGVSQSAASRHLGVFSSDPLRSNVRSRLEIISCRRKNAKCEEEIGIRNICLIRQPLENEGVVQFTECPTTLCVLSHSCDVCIWIVELMFQDRR